MYQLLLEQKSCSDLNYMKTLVGNVAGRKMLFQEVAKWFNFTRIKLLMNGSSENMLIWGFLCQKTCRRNENPMWLAIETGYQIIIRWELQYMPQVIILQDRMGTGCIFFRKRRSTPSHAWFFRHFSKEPEPAAMLYRPSLVLMHFQWTKLQLSMKTFRHRKKRVR